MRQETRWLQVDRWNRSAFVRCELRRRLIKCLKRRTARSLTYLLHFSFLQAYLPVRAARARSVNRCLISGRTYNTLRVGRLSRFQLRSKTYNGSMGGFRHASW